MTPERIVADLKVRNHADGLLASAAACAVAGVLVAAEEGHIEGDPPAEVHAAAGADTEGGLKVRSHVQAKGARQHAPLLEGQKNGVLQQAPHKAFRRITASSRPSSSRPWQPSSPCASP